MSDTLAPRRVLIIAKAYPPEVGGVESYSEFLARAYLARGIEPVVVSCWKGPRGWHDRACPEGVIRVLNVGFAAQPVVFLRFVLACARLRTTQSFDFMHPTTWRPALAVLPFQGRTPLVLTVHGQEVSCCPPAQKPAMMAVLRRANILITVSTPIMTMTKQVLGTAKARGDWSVCFNGLSYLEEAKVYDRPTQSPDAVVRILSFCRLAERKNIHGCLVALARLRDDGITNFHYTIAGTGPLAATIAAQIKTLGLDDLVQMTGYVRDEDIMGLYCHADIFLHPQTAAQTGRDLEGFGLAIADAMSFGAMAIVGKDGGPADFVAHNERGLVVDGNDFDQITAALRQVLANTGLRNRLATTGRQWCLANLSWDRHVGQILTTIGGVTA